MIYRGALTPAELPPSVPYTRALPEYRRRL